MLSHQVFTGLLLLLTGCTSALWTRGRGREVAFTFTSEASTYLPVGRFQGRVQVVTGQVLVFLDTAIISAPGPKSPMAPLVAQGLTLSGVLGQDAAPEHWSAVTASRPVRVADSLRLGESRVITGLRFTLTLPPSADLDRTFLAFQLEGRAVTVVAGADTIRTFACDTHNLGGGRTESPLRARLMRANYNAAC